jgi:hypothetical protein
LRSLKDGGVQQLLTKVYGAVREASADKKAEIEKYRRIYAAGYSQPGDGGRGQRTRARYDGRQDRLVAQVDSVEVSDGDDGASQLRVGEGCAPRDDLHC